MTHIKEITVNTDPSQLELNRLTNELNLVKDDLRRMTEDRDRLLRENKRLKAQIDGWPQP